MNESMKQIWNIFGDAIKLENNGLFNYLKMAKNTNDMTGKNMFIQLALDEFEHKQILEKQYLEAIENDNIEIIDIPKTKIEKLVPHVSNKQKRIRGENGLAEIEAINVALEFEKKSRDYYLQNADKIENEQVKSYFLRLAEWEQAHYDILKAELDYITQTGFWFDIPEFRMDGKF